MAVIASDVLVLAPQLEVGFFVVEVPDLPVTRVMACFTARP